MDRKSFGRRLNCIRKEKLYSSESLSEKCGVTAVFIRQVESGSKLPRITTLIDLCNALEISPNYLLADSLKVNEQEQFDKLWKQVMSLTPKQMNMVSAMLNTILDE